MKNTLPFYFGTINEPENTKCPHCGFDFNSCKPQPELIKCKCGKTCADVQETYIRIIFDEIKPRDKKTK